MQYRMLTICMALVLGVLAPAAFAFEVIEYENAMGMGETYNQTNIALASEGAAVFAKDFIASGFEVNYATNGSYAQSSAATGWTWIAGSSPSWIAVDLAEASTVDRVAFTSSFPGRTGGTYEVQVTTDADPTTTVNWTSVGSLTIADAPLTRRLIRFGARENVTGVRLVVTGSVAEIAINEFEVYAAENNPTPSPVTLYPFYEPGTGPSHGLANIAPLGTAFASTENWPASGLNDGIYYFRTPNSWMGTTNSDQFGVVLDAAADVDALALAFTYKGRTLGAYEVLYTTDPSPDPSTASWTSLGSFAIQESSALSGSVNYTGNTIGWPSSNVGFNNTLLHRAVVDFDTIPGATAIAVNIQDWDTSTGNGIAEMEIYEADAGAAADQLTRVDYWQNPSAGATAGDTNVAAGGTGIQLNNLGGYADWGADNVFDGDYDVTPGAAWLSQTPDSWVGVALASPAQIYRVAVSSNNGTTPYGRTIGEYRLQYTTDATVNGSSTWTELGVWNVPTTQMRRAVFEFTPVANVTGVRVRVNRSDIKTIAIDEIEVYTDGTAPNAYIGVPDSTWARSADIVTFPVEFTGADSVNLTAGNVTINHNGTAGGSVNIIDGNTAMPSVEVSGVTGDGSFTIGVAAGVASDAAGNTSAAPVDSVTVQTDNTAPTVTVDMLTTGDMTPTLTGTASDNIGVDNVEVTVDGQVITAVYTPGSPGTWSADVPVQLAGGTYDVVAVASDASGNSATDATTDELVIDNSNPAFSGFTVTPAVAGPGDTVTITFSVSEPLGSDPTVTLGGLAANIDSSTPSGGGVDYTFSVTLPGTAVPGPLDLSVSGEDTSGNPGSGSAASILEVVRTATAAWPEIIEYENAAGMGATYNETNIALTSEGATVFAKDNAGAGFEEDFATNGSYDNLGSATGWTWVAGSSPSWIGVTLAEAATVDRVAFTSPDATLFTGQIGGIYEIQVTSEADPASTSNWTSVGSVTIADSPSTRRLLRFGARENVTGVRLVVTGDTAPIAIQEFEVYAANADPDPAPVTLYPFHEPGTGPSYGLTNIAPAGTAFASTVYDTWLDTGLNDGNYYFRDPNSWRGEAADDQFGVVLDDAADVDALALAFHYKGRTIGAYEVLYTTDPSPDPATASWTSVGSFAIQESSRNTGITGLGYAGNTIGWPEQPINFNSTLLHRAVIDFDTIPGATAIAVNIEDWDTSTGNGIVEMEIFEADAEAGVDPLRRIEYFGKANVENSYFDTNIAPVSTPIQLNNLFGAASYADFGADNAVDGDYDVVAGAAWIAWTQDSWVGVELDEPTQIYRVAVSSNSSLTCYGRSIGEYRLQYTRSDPFDLGTASWTDLGVWNVPTSQMRRALLEFPHIDGVTAVRVRVNSSDLKTIAIDELEVYTDSTPPNAFIGLPVKELINNAQTVTFPVEFPGANVVNLTPADVTINHNGTAGGSVAIVAAKASETNVRVTGITGNGTFTISIAAGVASDAAGNTSVAPADSVSVDFNPDFSNLAVFPKPAEPGETVTITFSVSETLSGDPTVTLNGMTANLVGSTVVGGVVNYTYSYTVPQDAVLGPVSIAISGIDGLGNVGAVEEDAFFEVGQTLPVMAWPAALLLVAAGAAALRRKKRN
jgi:hypothetical protein